MSTPPSLLDILDTTVTLEWAETRSMGTLLQLGGRSLVVTALRAPEVGTTVFLRIEDDKSGEAMAVDGTCTGVTQSDWGEQEVALDVKRVGTVASAAALRSFLERHGLEPGGAVSVGRNRDNPDLKRYVYTLPEPKPGSTATSPILPANVTARNPAPVVHESTKTLGSRTDLAAQIEAARSAAAAPQEAVGLARPTAPSPPPAVAISVPMLDSSADQELADLLSALSNERPTPAIDTLAIVTPTSTAASPAAPAQAKPAAPTRTAGPSADENATVELSLASLALAAPSHSPVPTAAQPLPRPPSPPQGISAPGSLLGAALKPAPAKPAVDLDHDFSEKILVQTVDQATTIAAPVVTVPGRDRPAPSSPALNNRPTEQSPMAGLSHTEPLGAAPLFATDSAQRVEIAVQFELGPKKKKIPGTLIRLGESKLRVCSDSLPQLYERLAVLVPLKNNPKNLLTLRCEVTRVRTGEDGSVPCFDARLTAAGNTPAILAKVRELLNEPPG